VIRPEPCDPLPEEPGLRSCWGIWFAVGPADGFADADAPDDAPFEACGRGAYAGATVRPSVSGVGSK